MENKIAQWLTYQPRTRLVFIKRKYESIQFVDIGYELAKAIEPEIGNPIMPMKAEQIARDIIKTNQKSNEIFGNYVALENWGILLEPELKINLKNFLSNISQNTTIILLTDEPIKESQLHDIDFSNIEFYQPD